MTVITCFDFCGHVFDRDTYLERCNALVYACCGQTVFPEDVAHECEKEISGDESDPAPTGG